MPCLSWAQHSFHWNSITSGSHVLSSLQTICTRIPSGINNSSTFWFGRLRGWHSDFTKLSGVCDKQLDKGGHWSPCLGVQIWLHYCTETRFLLTVDQNQRALESVLLRNKDRVLFILASWGKVPWRAVMLSPAARCPEGCDVESSIYGAFIVQDRRQRPRRAKWLTQGCSAEAFPTWSPLPLGSGPSRLLLGEGSPRCKTPLTC